MNLEHGHEANKGNGDVANDAEKIQCENGGNVIANDPRRDLVSKRRAKWGNDIEFLMSCIAMSVGLGNVWRFPYAAYENGGGAFIIPYVVILVLVGRPIYYLEMCLGQFTSKGNVKMFEALAPALKGIGYGQLIGSICVATYYCSLVALTFFYLIHSFTADLPWSKCRQEWTQEHETCVPSSDTSFANNSMSSSELYLRIEVLKEKRQIDDGIGYPEWRLSLCLLFSWFVTFVITRRGVQSSGKASYFLAIFPYLIMVTLLVRAATLDGAAAGMLYFIKPTWSKLMEPGVWYAAVTQCFFSLNVGFGTITMYASYNDFGHNVYRDALVVTTLDTFTSMLTGTTIFGILGSLAYKLNVDVSDVVNAGGTGLAFISYPEAIAKFDGVPWLFAILFFFMLFVLGIGSLVAMQGCVYTIVMETSTNLKDWQISLVTIIGSFLIGLVYVTPGGQYVLNLVDYFGGTFLFFIVIIFELLLVSWWYGLENFCEDVEFMLKRKVGVYWRLSWGLITPVILLFIFFYFVFNMKRLQHENRDYPDVALACGWLIIGFAFLQVILWWSYYLCHQNAIGFIEGLKASLSHSSWGPANSERYEEWAAMKRSKLAKKSKRNMNWFKHKLYLLLGKQVI